MKRLFLITGFIISWAALHAQSDSITTRIDITMKYKIKKNLIPQYENLLNFISDKITGPNEVEEAINNNVKGSGEIRIFSDDKVTIENDLKPVSDTSKITGSDMDVTAYLNTFNTNYSKSEDKTISLNFIDLSVLKKTTYFYYNVLFECNYNGTNSSGEKFNKFNRVAEIKIVNDQGWHAYINSVRFAKGTAIDTSNMFKDIIKTETEVDKILSDYDNDEQKRIREENSRITGLIEEGDEYTEHNDYENALKRYREARKINIYNKLPQEKIETAKKALDREKQEKLAKAEKEKHIEELKKLAIQEQNNFNFKEAFIICDSLINDFSVSDPHIVQLMSEMSSINSTLTAIESAMESNNLKEAVKRCENKIVEADKSFRESEKNKYKAELYYRLSKCYYTLDSTDIKRIKQNLNQAIALSTNRHQRALKLRVKMYLNEGAVTDAIQDASQMIYNDSRNPDNHLYRAYLYERDKKDQKAIEDYKSAINLNATDSTAYQKKSVLEYNALKFSDAKKTASEGIEKTICYGMLYFNRGIANNKLGDCQAAGEDFIKAKHCGIEDKQRTYINQISETYVSLGKTNFTKGALFDARNQFSNAILIDSNEHALYGRARTYILLDKNDSAITDLDKLVRRRPDYFDAHGQRGIAYSNLKNFEQANSDFTNETKRFSNNSGAWYAKGSSEIIQNKFAEAASSFEHAATIQPSDSAWYKASYSYYYSQNYNKCIEAGNKARELNGNMFQIYYICGRAFYDKKQLKDAIKEFERALELESRYEDLLFAYASALEANQDFISASQNYDRLSSSGTFKDTSTFRSGVCLVKNLEKENFTKATNKFDRYIINSNNPDKSEVFAWAAYAYLLMDAQKNADEFIDKSQKANPGNAMLLYVLACRNVKNSMYDDAFSNLDKAIPALKLQKSDLDDNPLLRPLRKNSVTKGRYEQMTNKYFK